MVATFVRKVNKHLNITLQLTIIFIVNESVNDFLINRLVFRLPFFFFWFCCELLFKPPVVGPTHRTQSECYTHVTSCWLNLFLHNSTLTLDIFITLLAERCGGIKLQYFARSWLYERHVYLFAKSSYKTFFISAGIITCTTEGLVLNTYC